MKIRLDQYLVQHGMIQSRERAKALIMAGVVFVNEQKVDKAGEMIKEDAKVEVRGHDIGYVSRGGLKLEKAMQCFPLTPNGKVCMDIGASTGGFTDCMLQNGAVKGPKGSLNSNYHPLMTVKVEGNEVLVSRPNDEPQARSLHGLTRTNIANMVNGVVNGYEKKLEIVGVGLRCQKQGSNLVMNLGFSHQVNIPDTEDCTIVWQDPNHFTVTGIDKQKVGQYAAEIRAKKPPEPYKGKGIRYEGEVVKHKEGKAGKGKK